MGSRGLEGQGQSTGAVGEADKQPGPGVAFGASSEHCPRGALLGDKNHWGVRADCCMRRVQLSLLMWKAVVLLKRK